jgi:1-acyl-sn-glycerol-3-phosphate acyltransferase
LLAADLMRLDQPLQISRSLLLALGTRLFVHHEDRIPQVGAMIVVSNHRSFMDAPLLMAGINRPIRFACHRYMEQVPGLREVVNALGCLSIGDSSQSHQGFFHQASQVLQELQVVGIFPEGGQPMVRCTQPQEMGQFHRGFAHLALRAAISDLVVLPIAIAPQSETIYSAFPLRLLSLFDPSEPLFQQPGWHPLVLYRRVNLFIGRPYWISPAQREHYRGKTAKTMVADLTQHCHTEISSFLDQASF